MIIVTGGSGLLGNAFKHILVPSKEVKYPTHKELNLSDKTNIIKYIDKFNFSRDNSSVDTIIHLAGMVGGVKANTEKVFNFYSENSNINNSVIDAAIYTDTPNLVCCLSTCIYPDEKYVQYPLTEDQLHNGPPHNSNFGYAYAKRMVDVQLRAANQQYGHEYISVIPNNMYGEHDNFDLENGHVIPALIRKIWEAKINNKPTFEVWGDGEIYREFTYAEDIARAILFYLEQGYNGGPINIGCTKEYKLKDIINLICKELEYEGQIVYDTTKPKGQIRKPTSNAKFIELGWREEMYTPIEIGLKKTCDWFKINYPNVRGV
jgi:GDP-L-fucose synthase